MENNTFNIILGIVVTIVGAFLCTFLYILSDIKYKARLRKHEQSKRRNDKGVQIKKIRF